MKNMILFRNCRISILLILFLTPFILLEKRGGTLEFKIIVHFESTPFNISFYDWEQKYSFGELPEYISLVNWEYYRITVKTYLANLKFSYKFVNKKGYGKENI